MTEVCINVQGLSKRYQLGRLLPRRVLDAAIGRVLHRSGRLVPRYPETHSESDATSDGWIWALKDVTFDVRRGEIMGIIGRNGAGKSTLLKILSRITEPTEGSARIRGRVRSLLEVGTGFHPELTGRENVFLNGAILGMRKKEIERKFDEIVAFAEVDQFIDTPVKRYSSGMYMRLGFAVAAHLEPDILIVDEVLAVGDAAFQKKCIGKMSDAAKDGRTVIFVSHNMATVQSLCQRGIFINNGTIVKDAAISEAVGSYLQSLEQAAEQDLSERTDRRGKGEIRLRRIDISTGEIDRSTVLATGRPAEFVFHVTAVHPRMTCVFTIYDQFGQAITNLNSAARSEVDTTNSNADDRLICRVDHLPLVEGTYRINAAISLNGQIQDHIEAAAVFQVEPGVIRGRPITRDTGYGSVALSHHWTLPF